MPLRGIVFEHRAPIHPYPTQEWNRRFWFIKVCHLIAYQIFCQIRNHLAELDAQPPGIWLNPNQFCVRSI
jgi:hypothetical protein